MGGPRNNRIVCFIAGAGHSGSTLVGLVLGSHPDVFYAGEVAKSRFLGDPHKPARKRQCKICGADCPIWGDFRAVPGLDLYEAIALKSGRPIVVDSTKKAGWVDDRLRELEGRGADLRLLYLQRDGRAVVNSRVRKYPERDPGDLIDRWVDQIRTADALFGSFPHPKEALRYEVFAGDPGGETRRLCGFLGVEFRPAMLEFFRFDHHPLGGNTGTEYLVAREHAVAAAPAAAPGEHGGDYYRRHDGAIRLDLRWRTELPGPVRDIFEARAEEVNRRFAWEA
jgi:hypothetical protein